MTLLCIAADVVVDDPSHAGEPGADGGGATAAALVGAPAPLQGPPLGAHLAASRSAVFGVSGLQADAVSAAPGTRRVAEPVAEAAVSDDVRGRVYGSSLRALKTVVEGRLAQSVQ